jgi:hypothetical protein
MLFCAVEHVTYCGLHNCAERASEDPQTAPSASNDQVFALHEGISLMSRAFVAARKVNSELKYRRTYCRMDVIVFKH